MYAKQTKRLKWQKIALVGLMTLITLAMTILPSFAASSGNVGTNVATIPLNIELRYPDKAVYWNATDRHYLDHSVNHDEIIISGRHILTDLITYSGDDVSSLMRKGVKSQYSLAPIGYDVTAPTFYLVKNDAGTNFKQIVPYVRIPSIINVEAVLTYDVYFGGLEKVGTVTRNITSPLGNQLDVMLYTFAEISQLTSSDWTTCRIDNLRLSTTTLTYDTSTTGGSDVLAGTWILDQNFDMLQGDNESYVTYYIPFVSNNQTYTGITFGDTIELIYTSTTGLTNSVTVWNNVDGWVNEEYRTLYFYKAYTWGDVVYDDGYMQDGSSRFRNWLTSNAIKRADEGGYDGGYILHYRYQCQSIEEINGYMMQYFAEYNFSQGGGGDTQSAYDEGYRLGIKVGKAEGEKIGYNKAMQETNPDVTSWLSVATQGILSFEILPNISFLSILGIVITIALVIALLKFFAGG